MRWIRFAYHTKPKESFRIHWRRRGNISKGSSSFPPLENFADNLSGVKPVLSLGASRPMAGDKPKAMGSQREEPSVSELLHQSKRSTTTVFKQDIQVGS